MRILIVALLTLIAWPTVDAVAQPDRGQVDGKTVFIPSTGQIIEDVRVVSLQDTTFLVTRPVIMTLGGQTYPKMQTWMRLGEKTDFFVVDSRGQAEQLRKRHSNEKMLELDDAAAANVQYRFFEHPSRDADPFEGKSLVAYAGSASPFVGELGVSSLGGEAFLTIPDHEIPDARKWTKLANVHRLEIFDTPADAKEYVRLVHESRKEILGDTGRID